MKENLANIKINLAKLSQDEIPVRDEWVGLEYKFVLDSAGLLKLALKIVLSQLK